MTKTNKVKYGRRITIRLNTATEKKLIRLYNKQLKKMKKLDKLSRPNISELVRLGIENIPEPK